MPTALLQLQSGQEALAKEGRGLQLLLQRDAPLRAFTILPNAALWKGNRAFLAIPLLITKALFPSTCGSQSLRSLITPAEGQCQR